MGNALEDLHGGPTTLHAHSRDAAQQGFYKACKTARACRDVGLDMKYPSKRKRWRTTTWKSPKGIRLHASMLLLSRARGLAPVQVRLPSHLIPLPAASYLEVRLVWDRAARHYTWHLVIEDGTKPAPPPPGDHTAAVDLGEIHPAALTDGKETVIISCRALRANAQYTAKRLVPAARETGSQAQAIAEMASSPAAQESLAFRSRNAGRGIWNTKSAARW